MVTLTAESASPAASFRDPEGVLWKHQDRVFRAVADTARETLEFLESPLARRWCSEGRLIRTWPVSSGETVARPPQAAPFPHLVEHDAVWFPSYPYEWPAEMLHAAAELTLLLAREALHEGFGLKDATPENVLFRGSRPVFVDVLSFEKRAPEDATWMAYGQFVRTFLCPLLAARFLAADPRSYFSAHRDGLEPEVLYRLAGWRRWSRPFLSPVTIPAMLSRREPAPADYRPRHVEAERAAYILRGQLRALDRQLERARPASKTSRWSDYAAATAIYTGPEWEVKERFTAGVLRELRPARVLDIGCNDGHYSEIAAKAGASVVAIDSDAVVAGLTWTRAAAGGLDILPLVVDLTRPTPAVGWRNAENASFLDRAAGRFDLVLALAVLHHMTVTERVPLDAALDLLADLSRNHVLLEFVGPDDPMFQKLVRGRQGLYGHLTPKFFESVICGRFDVVRSARIGNLHRWLFLLQKKDRR